MRMNKIYMLALLLVSAVLSAQTVVDYEQRYNLLVSQFGPSGVGVETVLNNWAKTDSTNIKLLSARFNYYFNKAQTTEVVTKSQKNYLGMKPLLSLKDSTGTDVYYYQESIFDDEIYGQALKSADKAVAFHPDDLDFRFMKANAYIAYEKESPDMALAYLLAMADEDRSRNRPWKYEGTQAEKGFFEEAMQEYCYSFYAISSPKALEAFLKLSEKMAGIYPDNPGFQNNIGTYSMVVKQDYKAALKCYDKVLKKHPEDYTAIRNALLAARKMKNLKLEKKYLQMVVKYGPENEQKQAQTRLNMM
jgi:tetratricopeptide (TPR) repeat protein